MLLEQFRPGSELALQRAEAMSTFSKLIYNAARKAGVKDLDPLLVSGVVAGINQICVQLASDAPEGHWETARAMAAIRRLMRALDEG